MSQRSQHGWLVTRIGRATLVALAVLIAAGWMSAGGVSPGSGIARAAGVYYVNGDTGNNSNDCTESSPISGQLNTGPCLSIGKAVLKAAGGGTVEIAGPDANFNGVYCE